MTDAEIAGYMNWRGPGAYTQHQLKRIRTIVEEVQRREREACAQLFDNISSDGHPEMMTSDRVAAAINKATKGETV